MSFFAFEMWIPTAWNLRSWTHKPPTDEASPISTLWGALKQQSNYFNSFLEFQVEWPILHRQCNRPDVAEVQRGPFHELPGLSHCSREKQSDVHPCQLNKKNGITVAWKCNGGIKRASWAQCQKSILSLGLTILRPRLHCVMWGGRSRNAWPVGWNSRSTISRRSEGQKETYQSVEQMEFTFFTITTSNKTAVLVWKDRESQPHANRAVGRLSFDWTSFFTHQTKGRISQAVPQPNITAIYCNIIKINITFLVPLSVG